MCGHVASLTVATDPITLAHRGIRAATVGGMSHVRLPIVGLGEENDQPVRREGWTISFVGEVLDFRDWRPDLQCDRDLVVETWLRAGPRGFCGFDGFWSVMALHEERRELHLLCDYLAQKPLYYRTDTLSAASEPVAILGHAPVDFDETYLAAVQKWGYCPEGRRTPWKQLRKVLPGETVILRATGDHERAVTDPLDPRPLPGDQLKEEIEAAVRRRVLSSDVPVAALVSGGLDSSIVWTLAKRHGDVTPVHVENGEWQAFDRIVGSQEPIIAMMGEPDLLAQLTSMQEPVDLGSLAPQVAIADVLKDAVNVVLTGDGADELFGGYGRSSRYDSQASDVWHELVMWHLPRLDRVMMRSRLEVRSPFLARRVAAAALGLAWSPHRQDKRFLRELFRKDLPKGVADQAKRPLRTRDVEEDREAKSRAMVMLFREMFAG